MGGGTLDESLRGLAAALSPDAMVSLTVGVAMGWLVGALPGLGGPSAVALLLPFVFDSPPTQAFALLIGLISVTSTTGDVTSILLGIPGEATAAATVLDGHPLAKRGEAGRALGASLGSSLGGSLFGALVLGIAVWFARPLSRFIGSPELFALAILGVCCALPLASRSPLRGLASGALGLTLATVGVDGLSGTPRFTLGQLALWDGIGLIPAALGLFAIPEIVEMTGRGAISSEVPKPDYRQFAAGLREALRRWRVVLRSSVVGTGIGLLPGVGASISQWIAYADAARRSPQGSEFGRGAIDGVIAPSAANNATLGGALVPTLALGVPGGLSSALFLTALVVKGLVPGPQMLAPESEGGHLSFVFSLGWMMALANVMAFAITWAASPWLVRLTRVRAAILSPVLLLLVFVGAFSERNSMTDVVSTVGLSVIGLAFVRYDWPRAPLLIGLVLGPLAESRLFVSLSAYGAFWWARPAVVLAGVLVLALTLYPILRRQRRLESTAPRPDRPLAAGERALMALLLVGSVVALAATQAFPARAAVFPRLALVTGFVALAVSLIRDHRLRAAGLAPEAENERTPLGTAAWVGVIAMSVWAFGFSLGAVVGVAAMMRGLRERPGAIVVVTGMALAFVELVMRRILHVPLPVGAVFDGMKGLVLR